MKKTISQEYAQPPIYTASPPLISFPYMDDPKHHEETPEMEENIEGEPEEGHEEHHEEPKASAEPRREGGGWLSKLIWLVILALIVWGGWTVYKRGTAQDAEQQPESGAETTPATNTPEQPAQ